MSTGTEVIPPGSGAVMDRNRLKEKAERILLWARGLVITTAEEYETAAKGLQGIKGFRKDVEDVLGPGIKRSHAAWKADLAEKADYDAPADEAERLAKGKILLYQQAERRRAEEEQRRLQELARKEEEKRREKEAKKAERRGDDEKAEEIRQQPVAVAPVIVAPEIPKVKGMGTRKTWRARVVDPQVIPVGEKAKEVDGKIVRGFWTLDVERLQAHAKANKGVDELPGVEFFEDESIASGSAR